MRNKVLAIISVVLIFASVGLFLYPTISTAINNHYVKGTVQQYNNQVLSLETNKKTTMLSAAQSYNDTLSNLVSDSSSQLLFNTDEEYESILKVTDDGQIGNVSIPSINCFLPIYHGDNNENLNKGAVHMPNTSFPIGGKSTHAVISAHTAYPGKELFNKLTDVRIGDEFMINVLDTELKYRVTEINVVLPSSTSLLEIVHGKDLCTLVTCTPYAVNTHRLLVRGERVIEQTTTPNKTLEVTNNLKSYVWMDLAIVFSGIVITLVILYLISRKRGDSHER